MCRSIDNTSFFNYKNIEQKIKFLLRYAILAPSTHNSQPWLFKIIGNSCELYPNTSVQISEADPLKRDLFISLGCCLENLILAAECFQMDYEVNLGSGDFDRPIATVFFTEIHNNKIIQPALLQAILKRKNVRGMFDAKPVPETIIDKCLRISKEFDQITSHFITDKNKIEKFARFTGEALKFAYKNPAFRSEMSKWINPNNSRKKIGIPGFALKMPSLVSLILPSLIPYINLGSILSKLNYKALITAPLVCIITTKENDFKTWFEVGRLAEKLMVEVCLNGLCSSIYVAAVEMGDFSNSIKEIIPTQDIPQFLFAIGKIDVEDKFTPRLPLESCMIRFQQ